MTCSYTQGYHLTGLSLWRRHGFDTYGLSRKHTQIMAHKCIRFSHLAQGPHVAHAVLVFFSPNGLAEMHCLLPDTLGMSCRILKSCMLKLINGYKSVSLVWSAQERMKKRPVMLLADWQRKNDRIQIVHTSLAIRLRRSFRMTSKWCMAKLQNDRPLTHMEPKYIFCQIQVDNSYMGISQEAAGHSVEHQVTYPLHEGGEGKLLLTSWCSCRCSSMWKDFSEEWIKKLLL